MKFGTIELSYLRDKTIGSGGENYRVWGTKLSGLEGRIIGSGGQTIGSGGQNGVSTIIVTIVKTK